MWIYIIDNVDMCVRWCECTYLVMRICIFDYVRTRARWISPYVWRNVRTQFRGCSPRYRNPFAALSQTVSSRRGRFIAPAYMKTPTKWGTEMRIRWNEYTYSIMWKHVIDNVDMRVRWNGNTYLMTWICVFDNVRIRARWIGPLRLTECSHPISWVFCVYFVGVRNVIAIRQQHYRKPSAAVGVRFIVPAYMYSQQHWKPFEMLSRNIRNVFVICRLHIQHLKVWVLHSKDALLRCKRRPFAA